MNVVQRIPFAVLMLSATTLLDHTSAHAYQDIMVVGIIAQVKLFYA